ncbi:hypothetical protein LINPERPRIM_LOCUS930 [Linum perenne]
MLLPFRTDFPSVCQPWRRPRIGRRRRTIQLPVFTSSFPHPAHFCHSVFAVS